MSMNSTIQVYQTSGSNEYLRTMRSAYSSDHLVVLDLLMSKALYENQLDGDSVAGVRSRIIERPPFEIEIPWDIEKVARVVCTGSNVVRPDHQRKQWIAHFMDCCNDFIRRQTLLIDIRQDANREYRFIFDVSLARAIIPNLVSPSPLTVPTSMYLFHKGHGQRECNAFLANRLMLVDRKMNGKTRPDSTPLTWPELNHITMLPSLEAWRRNGDSKERGWPCIWFNRAVKKPLESYGLFTVTRCRENFYVNQNGL